MRTRLAAGLIPWKDRDERPVYRPLLPLKAVVVPKALAKSHWRAALLIERSCPVIGAGKPGGTVPAGFTRGYHTLKRRILQGAGDQLHKETSSAVKELRPVNAEDRLNGVAPAKLFSAAPEVGGRRPIKVKLFNYPALEMQASEVAGFERQLHGKTLSFVRHPQYEGQDIYTVTCKGEADVGFLANVLSVGAWNDSQGSDHQGSTTQPASNARLNPDSGIRPGRISHCRRCGQRGDKEDSCIKTVGISPGTVRGRSRGKHVSWNI